MANPALATKKYKKIWIKILPWGLALALIPFGVITILGTNGMPADVLAKNLGVENALVQMLFQVPFFVGILATTIGLVFLILWIASLIADSALAKGRSRNAFFVLSLFFPLIMWIVVSAMTTDQATATSGTKNCPRCDELIKQAANLCKHCGSSV